MGVREGEDDRLERGGVAELWERRGSGWEQRGGKLGAVRREETAGLLEGLADLEVDVWEGVEEREKETVVGGRKKGRERELEPREAVERSSSLLLPEFESASRVL